MEKIEDLWAEKHRPTSIDDMLLDPTTKKKLQDIKVLKHCLFVSGPGQGKTTAAKILAKKFAPDDYLFLNAAEKNGIDTIRNMVMDFISTKAYFSQYKIIIFDEADSLTLSAQEALKNILEEYSDSCRFIFTCNRKEGIAVPILSRLQEYQFKSPSIKDVKTHLYKIAKKEKIVIPSEKLEEFSGLVETFYPDMRKCINELELACASGEFVWLRSDTFYDEMYQKIVDGEEPKNIRKWFIENHYTTDLISMYKFLDKKFDNVDITLLIDEYLNKVNVVDLEISFAAFIIKLSRIYGKTK